MTTKPSCLIIDDEPDLSEFIAIHLKKMGINTDCTETVAEAKHLLARHHYDLCLSDMRLPDGNGLDIVKHIGFQHTGLPIAIMTAFANADNAVSALKAGAFDYLTKPIAVKQLQALVKAAFKFGQSNEQKITLLGNSALMGQVRHVLERVSQNQAPLLITGELGTGKETAARLVHLNSERRELAFIKVNCAAINSENAEKDFFGYAKTSPQDQNKARDGFLKNARDGTLFLENIDQLPLNIQNKLANFIRDQDTDVRFIGATHQDLNLLMNQGLFNQDFYHHINVMSLRMPALREIVEDIPIIARHLLTKIAEMYGGSQLTISECAINKLKACHFIGNVRELRNTLERGFTLCDGKEIKAEDLLIKENIVLPQTSQLEATDLSLPDYLENIEKQAIRDALAKTRQNKTAAAKLLGVSFRTLRYRLTKLGLSKNDLE